MSSLTRFTFLFAVGMISISLQHLAAEGSNHLPSDSFVEGKGSSVFFYQTPEYPRDCSELQDLCLSPVPSGVYLIKPDGYDTPFEVYCDNGRDEGGWTVVQRRFDGPVDFKRNWVDYKRGFGFLSTEFWLGNDKISYLTNQALYELCIEITLDNGTSCNVTYDAFRISDEWSNFTLSTVGTYESNEVCRWKEWDSPYECNPVDVSTNFTDCNDVYSAGYRQDGVYCIRRAGWDGLHFKVYCNMSIDGGSWTVFQRRVNGSTDFNRKWDEYKAGFGDLEHEFWLGNEKLHYITQQATYEYRIDFVWLSSSYHNKYSNFHVDNETNKYRLTDVGSRTGTLGYSLNRIRNTSFSTYDQDNDGQGYNCAEGHRSGWWHGAFFQTYSYDHSCSFYQSGSTYVRCSNANPNGDYNGGNGKNVFDFLYDTSADYRYYIYCNQKYTEMKIRKI